MSTNFLVRFLGITSIAGLVFCAHYNGWSLSTTNIPPRLIPVQAVELAREMPMPRSEVRTRLAQTNGLTFAGTEKGEQQFKREIRLTGEGAAADFGLLKVYFASDAAAAQPIRIVTPEGRELRCRASFLAAYDSKSGECCLLGTVTNSIGLVENGQSGNLVTYTNAFDTIQAHLRYEYNAKDSSLVQDVILLENPQLPESFQAEHTRLEVWTVWYDSEPTRLDTQSISLRPQSTQRAEVLVDDQVPTFGVARMTGGGRAFSIGEPTADVPVAKTWLKMPTEPQMNSSPAVKEETFLIESLDYLAVEQKLKQLPQPLKASAAPFRNRKDLAKRLAMTRPASDHRPMLIAKANHLPGQAVVLDFTLIASIPAPAGIVSWWPAGYTAEDATGTNDGLLLNGADFAAGKVGPAFAFDGTQNVLISNTASLNPSSGLTVDAWVYISGGQGSCRDIVSKDGEVSDRQFLLGINTNNHFRAHVGIGGTFYYVDGTNSVAANTWYHAAMTYNGTNLVLYRNGVAEASATVTGSITATTQPVRIGGGEPQNIIPYYFQGRIDEVDLFNRALSSAEIAAIYNAGAAGKINPNCHREADDIIAWWSGDSDAYDLAGENHASWVGNAAYSAGYNLDAFSLDYESNLEITNVAGLNPATITLEAWVYPLQVGVDHQDIISKDGEGYDRQFLLTISDLGSIRGHVGVAEGFVYVDGTQLLSENTWYHIAMTYDGSDLLLYVNGQLDASTSLDPGGGILSTTEPLRIGGGAPEGYWPYFFSGLIDEAAVHGRALNGVEISSIYVAGGAGRCKPDMDRDGLPDAWERHYFGSLAQSANDDPDADGVSNLVEFRQGRNPNVGATGDVNGVLKLQIHTPLK